MGKLELPMPEMGKGLKAAAKDLETRIRAHVPAEFRESVAVTAFKRGKVTGLAIEYDDRPGPIRDARSGWLPSTPVSRIS